ncbi:MAG: bifunctional folylpolyglutamate synthase/dihydrofolate synthase [Marinifilaceae bacterium]
MNYQDTLNWMFAQLPMFQREGKAAYKANLDNTLFLDKHFNHPHQQFKTIHVAGTNGKGSTSHMVASILQEAGYKVGLYTSPHLKDFRERIKINGQMITEEAVIEFVDKNKAMFEDLHPSFFEMTVALAFNYFAEQKVDIAVIEVGLGGRLDSTNIIMPLVSVITNISPDHVALLGDTLPKIAAEKAGIIKSGVPVVIGKKDSAYDFVFEDKAKEVGAPLLFVSDLYTCEAMDNGDFILLDKTNNSRTTLHSQLHGFYQCENIPTAITTIKQLQKQGLDISSANINSGIAHVVDNTGLLGRWQTLDYNPITICDTGHNVAGITTVVEQLQNCKYNQLHFIIGMVNDKDVTGVLELLPKNATYYFTKSSIPRAMPETELAEKAQKVGLHGKCYPTVPIALKAAREAAAQNDLVFVGGSTFTVAEIV